MESRINVEDLLNKIRSHPESHKMGMVASHLGIVRGTSRSGDKVEAVEVSYDKDVLNGIVQDIKKLPGIIEVLVEFNEGLLQIGDEILFVAVGGDIRENVFTALIEAVNRIKAESSKKKEVFIN
jgi:molybdopterin synthase catalytic subunit